MPNGNILEQLLQSAGQLAGTGRKKLQESPDIRNIILQGLLASLPPQFGIALQAGKGAQAFKTGVEQSLNPLQQNVFKTVQKVQKEQVEEAMSQGASGEQVLTDAGVNISSSQPQDTQTDIGQRIVEMLQQSSTQTPAQQVGQTLQTTPMATGTAIGTDKAKQVLAQLLPAKGLFTTQRFTPEGNIQLGGKLAMGGMSLDQISKLMELTGQQPLQVGEKEKIELEGSADIQKAIMTEFIKADKEGKLKPNDLFQGFEQTSKAFLVSRDSHARVEASVKDPSAAGDLALIFNYMKVLDPGSTVREGEFATAQEAASFLQRKYGQIARFTTGGRLSPKSRADFLDRSRRLFKAGEEQQNKTTKEFRSLAVKNKLDPDLLFRDVGLQQTMPTTQSITGQTSSGNKYKRVE